MQPWRERATGATARRGMPARSIALLAICLTLAGCSPARTVESVRFLRDLASDEEREPMAQRVAHTYQVDGRYYEADLYLPTKARGSIVAVPGMSPEGRDDPRLVEFAHDLARAEMLVLVPEIPNVRELRVSASDADSIADAVRHLAEHRHAPGLVAISYAAGPAVIAAKREEVAPHLHFMVLIGGYYSVEAMLRFFTTGYYRESPKEPWLYREPSEYGKWVFARSNAPRLEDPDDQAALTAMADRKLENLDAPIDDLIAELGPEGRSVYDLMMNRDPAEVGDLMAGLPPSILQELHDLDLSRRDLSRIKANVILIHGRDDLIIPATESEALASALPSGQADLYLISSLDHADLGDVGLSDGITLWRAAYRFLTERDSAAPTRPAAKAGE